MGSCWDSKKAPRILTVDTTKDLAKNRTDQVSLENAFTNFTMTTSSRAAQQYTAGPPTLSPELGPEPRRCGHNCTKHPSNSVPVQRNLDRQLSWDASMDTPRYTRQGTGIVNCTSPGCPCYFCLGFSGLQFSGLM